MKTETKHTPTTEYWLGKHDNKYIIYKGNYVVCTITEALDPKKTGEEIVRACNSHRELVKTLRICNGFAGWAKHDGSDVCYSCGETEKEGHTKDCIHSTITKAEGK